MNRNLLEITPNSLSHLLNQVSQGCIIPSLPDQMPAIDNNSSNINSPSSQVDQIRLKKKGRPIQTRTACPTCGTMIVRYCNNCAVKQKYRDRRAGLQPSPHSQQRVPNIDLASVPGLKRILPRSQATITYKLLLFDYREKMGITIRITDEIV